VASPTLVIDLKKWSEISVCCSPIDKLFSGVIGSGTPPHALTLNDAMVAMASL
jgi:hypothetical protein